MESRKIGSLSVSIVGIGCNNFGSRIDDQKSAEVVDTALEEGINFFDTADMYADGRSEQLLGRSLRGRRSKAIVATKFANDMVGQGAGAAPEYVRKACDASLKRLGMDYIDLYQQHVPDPKVPIADTLGALTELVSAGKVREIGCSNFSAEQLRDAKLASARLRGARFAAVQNEYSLLHREPEDDGVLEETEREGIAFLPFFPLKAGLLTGKFRKGTAIPRDSRVAKFDRYKKLLTEDNLDKIEALIGFANDHNKSLLELAVSWLLAHPTVASVIAGASSAEHVRKNATAATWKLDAADLREVDALLRATV
jgi:aryl-alcohol dehydrogenase-like predicted oxidoreductase